MDDSGFLAALRCAGYLGNSSYARGGNGKRDVKHFSTIFQQIYSGNSSSVLAEASLSEAQALAAHNRAFTLACEDGFIDTLLLVMRKHPDHVGVQQAGCSAIEFIASKQQNGGPGFFDALSADLLAAEKDWRALAYALNEANNMESFVIEKSQLLSRQKLLMAGALNVLDEAMSAQGINVSFPRRARDYLMWGEAVNRALKGDNISWTYTWSLWWEQNALCWSETVGLGMLEFIHSPSQLSLYLVITQFPAQKQGTFKNATWKLIPSSKNRLAPNTVTRSIGALQLQRASSLDQVEND